MKITETNQLQKEVLILSDSKNTNKFYYRQTHKWKVDV